MVAARREALNTRRAVLHLKHRELSLGLNAWISMMAEQEEVDESREAARRVVLRLMQGKLSAGWNSWEAFASERQEALKQIQNCLSNFVNRKLSTSWNSWVAMVRSSMMRRSFARAHAVGFGT